MSTAIATNAMVQRTNDCAMDLRSRQEQWDRFFEQALASFDDPNPNLCRDLALDKTIRALGQRPRPPLNEKEREDLEIERDVAAILGNAAHVRSNEERIERERLSEMRIYNEDDEFPFDD